MSVAKCVAGAPTPLLLYGCVEYSTIPGLFGRLWSTGYDERGVPDPAPAVEFLASVARGASRTRVGHGSGRVALPLAARGLAVEGVEASPEMVAADAGEAGRG